MRRIARPNPSVDKIREAKRAWLLLEIDFRVFFRLYLRIIRKECVVRASQECIIIKTFALHHVHQVFILDEEKVKLVSKSVIDNPIKAL